MKDSSLRGFRNRNTGPLVDSPSWGFDGETYFRKANYRGSDMGGPGFMDSFGMFHTLGMPPEPGKRRGFFGKYIQPVLEELQIPGLISMGVFLYMLGSFAYHGGKYVYDYVKNPPQHIDYFLKRESLEDITKNFGNSQLVIFHRLHTPYPQVLNTSKGKKTVIFTVIKDGYYLFFQNDSFLGMKEALGIGTLRSEYCGTVKLSDLGDQEKMITTFSSTYFPRLDNESKVNLRNLICSINTNDTILFLP